MSADTPVPVKSKSMFAPPLIALCALGLYGGYRYHLSRQPYEWSGTVEARTVSLGSRAGGRVKEVLVREGDPVKVGQPLVVLESGDWPAQLLQAQGQLTQAQANLDKLKKGARPEEIEQARARAATARAALDQTVAGARPEQVAAAQARLSGQEVAVEKAKMDADRMHKLADSGAAARADVDNADIALKSAIAQRDALKQQYDEIKNGSRREELEQAKARQIEQWASERLVTAGSRVEDIRAAEGQVEAAQGRVDQIKTMIEELTIRASVAARVEALDLRPGDILAPSAPALTLLEEDQLYVRIYVPETLLGHVSVGQTVPINVDSFSDKTFDGVVEHINGVGEYSPRNLQTADERADQVFATRVGIRNGRDKLRAGMAAFIKVAR
jgi:multidrug resistance efflux pump